MKNLYYFYRNSYDYNYCWLLLPKRKGKGLLKSPCGYSSHNSDDLVKAVQESFYDAWLFSGEKYILQITFPKSIILSNDSIVKSILKLTNCFYGKTQINIVALKEYDEIFSISEKVKKS